MDQRQENSRSICWSILGSGWTRLVIAVVILGTLYWLDRFNPGELLTRQVSWSLVFLALFLVLASYALAAVRYRVILKGMDGDCTFRQVWSWTMIGIFGELILPFFGGGDVVKAVYVAPSQGKSRAAASVMVDRLLGALGLLLFAVLACLCCLSWLLQQGRFTTLIVTVLTLAALFVLSALVLYVCHQQRDRLYQWLAQRSDIFQKILNFLSPLGVLVGRPRSVLAGLLLAVIGNFCGSVAVVALSYGMGIPIPIGTALLILPFIFLSNVISVFGGIGGGLFAFEYLFHYLLGTAPGQGALIGVTYILLTNISKLSGLPWYLSYRREQSPPIEENLSQRQAA